MGIWDLNNDGHLDGFEMDRYLLDNGLLPGQPDGYWYEGSDDDDPFSLGSSYDDSDHDDSGSDTWSSYDYGDYGSDYGYDDDYEDYDDDSPGSASHHASSHGKAAAHGKKSCYNCLYWCDIYDDWRREDGCRIFNSCISKDCPDIDGYVRPKQDGKTCAEFRPRLEGRTLGCLECKHFRLYDLKDQRYSVAADFPIYCDIKGQVEDIAGIAKYDGREYRLWFTVICPRFELEDSRLSNEPESNEHALSVKSCKASGQS